MHFLDIIRQLERNYIWRCLMFLHWQKLLLQPPATHLKVFFSWSVNYANLFCNSFITFWICQDNKHCLYWKAVSSDIYRKIYFNSLLFLSYICWSVNCMNWVSKFKKKFLTYRETEARFIFEGFNVGLYGKLFLTLRYFFLLFLSGL